MFKARCIFLGAALAVVMFLLPVSGAAQNATNQVVNENGWQFLYWGMSEDDVRTAMSYNNKAYDGTDNRQHWFWYGFDENWDLLRLQVEELPRPGLLKWVRSGIEDTDFLFYDDKLFGVLIGKRKSEQFVMRLFTSMTQRYPEGDIHEIADTNMVYFRHQSESRVIVWQSNDREFGLGFFDIDAMGYLASGGDVPYMAASGDTEPAMGVEVETEPTLLADPVVVAEADPPGGVAPSAFDVEEAQTEPTRLYEPEPVPVHHFPGEVWREPLTGMEFVWIPGGCFSMGQTDAGMQELIATMGAEQHSSRYSSELPRHDACVDGFWMGRYEVTNSEFRSFDEAHDSGYALNADNQPAAYVSFKDAVLFAAWLIEQNQGRGFRLPSEAEWEYAARAGTSTIRPWGNDTYATCEHANVGDAQSQEAEIEVRAPFHCNDGYAVSAPVGSFQPNNFGLYDMMGNVWEWTWDMHGDYHLVMNQMSNPLNLEGYGVNRAIRGGSWASSPDKVRCAYHGGAGPDRKEKTLGFRLVMVENVGDDWLHNLPGNEPSLQEPEAVEEETQVLQDQPDVPLAANDG
ncbi:MAG: formylglycine-generating enzyme family protein [Desulfovibrio sp.]|nr:MAG: formylglycine-generating enzyme family protein [Desulfovibrio sp.]